MPVSTILLVVFLIVARGDGFSPQKAVAIHSQEIKINGDLSKCKEKKAAMLADFNLDDAFQIKASCF